MNLDEMREEAAELSIRYTGYDAGPRDDCRRLADQTLTLIATLREARENAQKLLQGRRTSDEAEIHDGGYFMETGQGFYWLEVDIDLDAKIEAWLARFKDD